MNGNYVKQPRSLQFASVFHTLGTNGGNLGLQRLAPTRTKADQLIEARMKAPFDADANDVLALQGENAKMAGFGIGMGLGYTKVDG